MWINVLTIFGGVGLFLVGMLLLTDGLRALAGDRLRAMLSKYTNSPVTGALTGAISTALVQSSSATTVTAVGFVGAGILTFNQSLGIIFGANIGTTLTGWLVAVLGFKIKLGLLALPLTFVGVCCHMFGKGVLKNFGWSLVGFSLLFIGIATMQQGASAYEGVITPASFPSDTLSGRLQLVVIGMIITLVTQSSSAGVATAMVALSTGSINFTQAAALVIGMDVGTTFTAALATIGGSTAMRRTGFAHVVYNVLTGVMALVFLALVGPLLNGYAVAQSGPGGAQMALAMFHSSFNVIGVLLILPLTSWFGKLIEAVIKAPEQKEGIGSDLDLRFLKEPNAAVDMAFSVIKDITFQLFNCLSAIISSGKKDTETSAHLLSISNQIHKVRSYIFSIKPDVNSTAYIRHVALIHVVDHLRRLTRRCRQASRENTVQRDPEYMALVRRLRDCIAAYCEKGFTKENEKMASYFAGFAAKEGGIYRLNVTKQVSKHMTESGGPLNKLDDILWLQRVAYHLWRIMVYLQDDIGVKAVKHIVGKHRV